MSIYLDHNATTPVHPEVVDAMTRVLRDHHGNPSSTHAHGATARRLLEDARDQVASLVGARARDVIFTGSATESNNTALLGTLASAPRGRRFVTTTIEHPSVEEPLRSLEEGDVKVLRVPVDPDGRADPAGFAEAVDADTTLVTVIFANNETGVLQDVPAISAAARKHGVPVHVDATQAVGRVPVSLDALGADLLAASGHKFNGPKGAAFLVDRSGLELPPHVRGGPQERRRRGGTENLSGIVGLGRACALAEAELDARTRHVSALRDRLFDGIRERIPRVRRNGHAVHVLPNTLNLEFEDTAGEVLLEALDGEGISVSVGAACHSGSIDPSAILTAMGRTPEQARGSLRWSVGPSNTQAEIDHVLAVLPGLVERVRKLAA